ncbi:ankyrin repeat domain-containing protein SOWAHB-like [Pristis pectinata]|uniref:ankyrin repeat domain-containing protein SOWAHB-like n=1 Tax=Pristis pectinata TaxID=685728 RepID=UPI00223CE02F|nr:ankyrin repeat domain-containing protein SOWAHB-like [Pristis pectinata]
MAEDFSQEAVLDFLLRHRGKVRNVDLTAYFRHFLRDPEWQLQNREQFKKFVNSLAVVKVEDGVKYIFLKKRYAEFIPEEFPGPIDVGIGHPNKREMAKPRVGKCNPPLGSGQVLGPQSEVRAEGRLRELEAPKGRGRTRQSPSCSAGEISDASRGVVQARNDSPKGLPAALRGGRRTSEASRSLPEPASEVNRRASEDQPVRQKDRTAVVNNLEGSVACKSARKHKNNRNPAASVVCTGDTAGLLNGEGNCCNYFGQPVLDSSTASPILSYAAPPVAKYKGRKPANKELPNCNAEITCVRSVPESIPCKSDQNSTGNVTEINASRRIEGTASCDTKLTNLCRGSSSSKYRSNAKVPQELLTGGDARVPVPSEECIPKNQGELSCRPLAGSGQPMGNRWHSEKESTSPKKYVSLKVTKSNEPPHKMLSLSRENNHPTVPKIIDAPLNVRDQPASSAQTTSHRECKKDELLKIKEPSEASSLVPLDSKEHQWIVKTAAGMFEQAYALFCEDPNFGMKKDFISGYTVLHWIAKHGNHRALTRFIGCARKHKVKLNVNIRSNCGYTPLHIATMYGQLKVIQYLVNKYHANFNLRDHSGKKPWQYLNSDASRDVFQMLGAPESKHAKPSRMSNTFSAKDVSRQKSSNPVSRKTSFSALLKSPQLMHKFMHLNSDHLHAINEEEETNED